MVSTQTHSGDWRTHKDRLVSTGTITLANGATSTRVSNLAVGLQSKIFLSPSNVSAWALFYDQTAPSTPIIATVETRAFTLTTPAAAGGETIDYIVVAGDLV
jgi:hypothetical protein